MDKIREALQGKKTYTIVGVFILIVALERFAGIDLPFIDIGDDWVDQLLIMLGIGTTRAAVGRA